VTEVDCVSSVSGPVAAGRMMKLDDARMSHSEINPESRLRLFEELILPHLDAAYNLARWLIRNEQDARDMVQEAYLRAFRFFDSYKGGDGKSWLLEVVRNTCFTWIRRNRRNLASVPFDETAHGQSVSEPNQEDALVAAAKQSILRNCIEALPDAFREVVVMRELEEMSYRQIAEVASLPVGTVMSRLSRARKRLEDCASGQSVEPDQ
jgi:RNA polymerase sigma-70 factor, ECF subfamily